MIHKNKQFPIDFRIACWCVRGVTTRGQFSAKKANELRTTPADQSDCRMFCSWPIRRRGEWAVIQDALSDEGGYVEPTVRTDKFLAE